jgi:hypothetical protein
MEYGDRGLEPSKDWLRPLVTSLLIFSEDTYRREIGLPSLLPGPTDGLMHSTFVNMVLRGDKNPLLEWETDYKRAYSEASGTNFSSR